MRPRIHVSSFLLIAVLCSPAAQPQEFTSGDIIAVATSGVDCLEYRISGLCFWLVCSIYSCDLDVTARVAHNLPDLVVSAYNVSGRSPWVESRAAHGPLSTGAGAAIMAGLTGLSVYGGGPLTGDGTENRGNLRFKEVDVVGSPSSVISNAVSDASGYTCSSDADPMFPYLLSGVDAIAWRTGVPDNLRREAVLPGRRIIGNWPLNSWGSIFPRSGFLVQTDDAKCAAVISQRGVDVVMLEGQPHVYTSLGDEGADENLPRWQMISPTPSSRCEAFGDPGHWSDGKRSQTGEYGHLYWRCYSCCVPTAGIPLGHIEWAGCEP